MPSRRPPASTVVSAVVPIGCVLFVADLFLSWRHVAVDMAGVFEVRGSASGWSGAWGVVAGILAFLILGLSLGGARPVVTAVAALGMLTATGLTIRTGTADVAMPMMGVTADTTRWPAWVGLALACVVAAAALWAAVAPGGGRVRPLWRIPTAR